MAANLKTKAQRRKLRELAVVAYTRELSVELAQLEQDFVQWRSGGIDAFELSDKIHRFHDGRSRELYVLYRGISPDHAVARAMLLGLLQEDEVPAEALSALESAIELYRSLSDGPTGEREA